MSTDIDTSTAKDIVDLQVLAYVVALCTRDLENQDAFIGEMLDGIARRSDGAITKIAENMDLPESLRNQLFAECADHVAHLRMSALGVARDLRR
ncbi:hypothetical protein [Pseudorhodoferax sp. Leaf274]|uniref:hypothetical protein n=1 Tax=Pseudorhodoferax sp. Leaf274 TaxID=1736318 RepID=UPI00070241ED|nr:hypothetical protein [Pseudorhodoferax sp. Leaf274]KQP35872.1 hypothetical protein ASF44_21485 [Pseudorhodoferax sp. Leaf274]